MARSTMVTMTTMTETITVATVLDNNTDFNVKNHRLQQQQQPARRLKQRTKAISSIVSLVCLIMMTNQTLLLVSFVDGFSVTPSISSLSSITTRRSKVEATKPIVSSSRVQLHANNNPNNNDDDDSAENFLNTIGDKIYSLIDGNSKEKEDSVNIAIDADNMNTSEDVDDDTNKFDMKQRIESLKSIVLGAIAGGVAVTPIAYLHYVYFTTATAVSSSSLPSLFTDPSSPANGLAQWEFVTDTSSIEAGLFAVVYRYAVRKNDNNPMLNQGVVGAFIVVRSLTNIQVTDACESVPLRCGPPLGYFDWNMITQGLWNGTESVLLFGVAALAMEFAFKRKWISKF